MGLGSFRRGWASSRCCCSGHSRWAAWRDICLAIFSSHFVWLLEFVRRLSYRCMPSVPPECQSSMPLRFDVDGVTATYGPRSSTPWCWCDELLLGFSDHRWWSRYLLLCFGISRSAREMALNSCMLISCMFKTGIGHIEGHSGHFRSFGPRRHFARHDSARFCGFLSIGP